MYNSDFPRGTKFSTSMISTWILHTAVLGVLMMIARPAQAQTERVLYSFAGTPDGANPWTSLVRDSKGNFYGTTNSGPLSPVRSLRSLPKGWRRCSTALPEVQTADIRKPA